MSETMPEVGEVWEFPGLEGSRGHRDTVTAITSDGIKWSSGDTCSVDYCMRKGRCVSPAPAAAPVVREVPDSPGRWRDKDGDVYDVREHDWNILSSRGEPIGSYILGRRLSPHHGPFTRIDAPKAVEACVCKEPSAPGEHRQDGPCLAPQPPKPSWQAPIGDRDASLVATMKLRNDAWAVRADKRRRDALASLTGNLLTDRVKAGWER